MMIKVFSNSFSRKNVLISLEKWPFVKLNLASRASTVTSTPRVILKAWTSHLPLTSKITTCFKPFFIFFVLLSGSKIEFLSHHAFECTVFVKNYYPKIKFDTKKTILCRVYRRKISLLNDNNLGTKGIT